MDWFVVLMWFGGFGFDLFWYCLGFRWLWFEPRRVVVLFWLGVSSCVWVVDLVVGCGFACGVGVGLVVWLAFGFVL